MVQILPKEPSLVERLGAGISAGISGGVKQEAELGKQMQLEQQKQALKMQQAGALMQMLGMGGQQQQQPQAGMGQQQGFGATEGGQAPEMAQEGMGQPSATQGQSQLERIATDPGAMMMLTQMDPQSASQIQSMYSNLLTKRKTEEDRQLKKEELQLKKEKELELLSPAHQESMLGTIGAMREMIPYVGSRWGLKTAGGPLRRETIEKRNEFDSAVSQFLGVVREQESRGNLPKGIFEDMLRRVPDSKLSERENKGRLNAFENRIKREMAIREKFLGKQPQTAFKIGQTFKSLPKDAPDGSLMTQGSNTYVRRKGKWSLK